MYVIFIFNNNKISYEIKTDDHIFACTVCGVMSNERNYKDFEKCGNCFSHWFWHVFQ